MGKRNKRYEEEVRTVECEVCKGEIPFEFYLARGDMLCCDECGAEYIIKSCKPVRMLLLEEEFDDDDDYSVSSFDDDDDDYPPSFDDDLYDDDGRGYD